MNYYDSLKPARRRARSRADGDACRSRLRTPRKHGLLRHAVAGFDAAAINSRAALARLPVTRKSDLLELQKAAPPFGGLTAHAAVGARRGCSCRPARSTIPKGAAQDWWRFARALFAAGFRAGDLVHNTFSYHFTPGGFMLEGAARKLGCPVFPAGIGQTEMQVQAIADLQAGGLCRHPVLPAHHS